MPETCAKCGSEMEKIYQSYETEIYSCPKCRSVKMVNLNTGEESRVGWWRPEITE